MVATVATRRVVSMFALCAYCPAATSFRCLNCGTAMCPDCCPSDYCPECQPAPVAPFVVLGGWRFADEGVEDDAVAVECAGCGDRIYVDDPTDDAYCAACSMPAAEVAALRMVPVHRPTCERCGFPLRAGDPPRCAACTRLYAR